MKFMEELGKIALATGHLLVLTVDLLLSPFIRCYNEFDSGNLGRSILRFPGSFFKGIYDVVKFATTTAYNLVTGAFEICAAPFVKAGLAIAYSMEQKRGLGSTIWSAVKGFFTGPIDALCDVIAFEVDAVLRHHGLLPEGDTIANATILKKCGVFAAEACTFFGSDIKSMSASIYLKKDKFYKDIPNSENGPSSIAQYCAAYNSSRIELIAPLSKL
jgi:hypothetical protein